MTVGFQRHYQAIVFRHRLTLAMNLWNLFGGSNDPNDPSDAQEPAQEERSGRRIKENSLEREAFDEEKSVFTRLYEEPLRKLGE